MLITISLAALVVVLLVVVKMLKKRRPDGASSGGVVSSGKLQDSLRDEKLRSEIILSAIEDGVVLIDKDGVIQSFNPGASGITGWSVEEAKGLDWKSVFKFVDAKGQPIAAK